MNLLVVRLSYDETRDFPSQSLDWFGFITIFIHTYLVLNSISVNN
jgi:hypothetical protein